MISSNSSTSFLWRSDARLGAVLVGFAGISTGILVLIVLFLVIEAWPVLERVGVRRFFSDEGWHPLENSYGLAPMLSATLATSAGAILLAAPVGVASAVFCRFYAPSVVARAYRGLVALLAGIPSVVYGFWGLTVLVPMIAKFQPPGASLLAGALVLALMILPTIALTADASIAAVPQSHWRGAASLGLAREAAIMRVMLPAARGSIAGGILLAAARALGETMALLMVAGNVVQMPSSIFDPVRTLTANIALEMAYATGDHRAALFVSGLVLTGLVTAFAALAWQASKGRHFV